MHAPSPLPSLAIVLLAAILGGELVRRLRLPRALGWLGAGLVLGRLPWSHAIDPCHPQLQPVVDLALGLIAFGCGAALRSRWSPRERHADALRNQAGTRNEGWALPLTTSVLLAVVGTSASASHPASATLVAALSGLLAAAMVLVVTRATRDELLGPAILVAVMGAFGFAQAIDAPGPIACTVAGFVLAAIVRDLHRASVRFLEPLDRVLRAGLFASLGMHL